EDEAAETEAVAARPRRAGSRQLAAGIAEVGAGRLPTEVEGGLPAARSERTRGPGQSEQPAVLQALGEVLGRPRDVGARRRLGERRRRQAGAEESEGQPKGQPRLAHSCSFVPRALGGPFSRIPSRAGSRRQAPRNRGLSWEAGREGSC